VLKGCELIDQFECADGYLFISDYDCPFEEITNFTLVDKKFRVISRRWIGGPYVSFLIDGVEVHDEDKLRFNFSGDGVWELAFRSWSIPFLRPRISIKRLKGA
jgi:hypothetical protein